MTSIQATSRTTNPRDGEDLSLDAIPISTPEELAARTILDNQTAVQRNARESQRAAQQIQETESAARIAKLHEAADQKLIAGIVGAVGEAGSAACSQGGDDMKLVGKLTTAGGRGAAAYFNAQGEHAAAAATQHEQYAARAGEAGREAADAARAAEQAADRNLQQLGQVLEARRRAEDAATRA